MAINYDRRFCAIILKDKESLAMALREVEPKMLQKPYQHIYSLIKFYYEKHKKIPTFEILEEKIKEKKDKIFDKRTDPDDVILSIRSEIALCDVADYEAVRDEIKIKASQDTIREDLPKVVTQIKDKDIKSAYGSLSDLLAKLSKNISESYIQRSDNHTYIEKAREKYNKIKACPETAWGLRTGYTELDKNTKGMKAGEMLIVAGRHGTGKSIWLLNAGINMFKEGANVVLFSLEMPEEQYWSRFLACYTGLPVEAIETGTLTPQQEEVFEKGLKEIYERPNKFTIIDVPQTTIPMMAAEMDLVGKPDVILVDYLGIVKATNDKLKDNEAQAQVVEDLRRLGRVMRIPILTAAQLNREPGAGKKKTKDSSRLSRSDTLGATADVIIMIEEVDTEDLLKRMSDKLKLVVVKNRKGKSPFTFEARRNFAAMRFENWDPGAVFSDD